MKEKTKEGSKSFPDKTRIIITMTIILLIFGIVYLICTIIGGAFEDFIIAARPWIILGIGLAGAITLLSTKEKDDNSSHN